MDKIEQAAMKLRVNNAEKRTTRKRIIVKYFGYYFWFKLYSNGFKDKFSISCIYIIFYQLVFSHKLISLFGVSCIFSLSGLCNNLLRLRIRLFLRCQLSCTNVTQAWPRVTSRFLGYWRQRWTTAELKNKNERLIRLTTHYIFLAVFYSMFNPK